MPLRDLCYKLPVSRFYGGPNVISLLFALMTIAIILAWRDRWRLSYMVFAVALVMSIYWLDYHATSPLTIRL